MAVIDGKWLSKEGLTYFWSKIKSIFTKQTETNVIANLGAKNLLDYTFSINGNTSARTVNDVTFTINPDRSISTSGTASANITTAWIQLNYAVPDDPVILSGCPTGGATNKYRIDILDGSPTSSVVAADYGNGVVIKSSMFTNGTGVIRIRIEKNQNVDGLVFKPMIRPAEITDDTFEPYAPTNRELYETEQRQEDEIRVVAAMGAKNIADFNFGGIVQNANVKPGTIVCAESNGTFSFSGTSADKNYAAYVLKQFLLKAGTYKITGVRGGSNTKYWMRVGTGTTDTGLFNFYDGEREFNLSDDTLITVQIVIYANQTVSNLLFKPMLRRAEITDNTFVPYAPTNRELYETEQRQETEIGVVANLGAKNMLYISNTPGYTATSHGRTFTVLSDGGIKITGTSSDNSNADFYVIGSWGNRNILLNENKDSCLIRMACDTNYGYSQIRLRVMNRSTGSTVNETGVETNKDVKLSHVVTTVFVSVFSSVTLPENGIVVYPMIRRAEITDDTYVPYAPTNRELYETSKPSYDFIFGLGTALSSNDDLNNYNKVGKVYVATGAIATTISNTPWTLSGFIVITIPMLTAASFIQFLLPNTSGGKWYKRRYTTGTWSAWIEYDGTQLATTQSVSPVSTLNLSRNDLDESLDSNFDLIDSIPEENLHDSQ